MKALSEVKTSARDALVAQVQRRLSAESYPRLTVMSALAMSGGCAFLVSVSGLRLGLRGMHVRYFLASLAGYLVFLGCIRLWIAYERRRLGLTGQADLTASKNNASLDLGDVVPDIDLLPGRGGGSGPSLNLFAGGRSGGGGGGAMWAGPVGPDTAPASSLSNAAGSAAEKIAGAIDLDDLKWLLVALAAALGSLLAVCWIIYVAPVLLAEVALDAALVSTAYRRLSRQDREAWTSAVLRRTWLPATVIVVMMTLMGWALQKAAPEAHSVGAVLRSVFHG
jgi:hypothetical protein